MVNQEVLKDLFAAFPDAIINHNLEFIADPTPRVNSYFRLDNIETREEAIAKVLEYLSREAYKSLHYNTEKRNHQVHDYHLRGINAFCGTAFTEDNIDIIYTHLGNGCNRPKTLKFIRSGYDLTVLTELPGQLRMEV